MTLPTSSSDRIGRLFSYWTALRPDGGVPNIASFDPLEVPDLLPNLWMAAWQDEHEDFVYRVAGDAILTFHDRPMHRRRLHEIYPKPLARTLRDRFRLICAEPCLYHSRGTIYILINRYGVGERLILPFVDRDATTPVILGLTDYQVVSRTARQGDDTMDRNVEIRSFLTLDGTVISSERAEIDPAPMD